MRAGGRTWLVAGLVLAGMSGWSRGAEAGEEAWEALFNGEDLSGWTVKVRGQEPNEDAGGIFRVQDGLLKVSYENYERFEGQFGHLFWGEPLSHYRLRLEYRFTGEQCEGGPGWAWRNSGVMIHGQRPESMEREQDFPVSIEVQLLGGGETGERPTGNVCTPGTHVVMGGELRKQHCIESRSKTYRGDQWVTAEIEVHGHGKIVHKVNGEVVLEYEQPQLDAGDLLGSRLIAERGASALSGGTISLQAESHAVEFRKVEILRLGE